MERNLTRQYFKIVILLSLAIAVTIHFPMVMNYISGDGEERYQPGFMVSFTHLGMELIITYIVGLLMFTLNFFILKPVEKHGRINPFSIILAVTLTVVSVVILNHLLFSVKNRIDPSGYRPYNHRDQFDYTNFFVAALVVGCVLVIRLIFQKQTVMIENESLRRESLQSRFESLKNQLSPHFLFNSLTALKLLIDEAPAKAQIYVDSLSKALRYSLQSNEKQLVTLQEELEFLESYLYLIKIRFGSNISVESKIDEKLLLNRIPPLTVQTLIENAIKHNEISKQRPLIIEILTTGYGSLQVINDIHRKLTEEGGTGIGLTNLSKQFRLISGNEVLVRQENNRFIVEIPLLDQET